MSNQIWSNAAPGVWARSLGTVASDPREGDEWTACKACSRPTNMTGTKLCDRCWELERNLAPGVTAALSNAAPELADALEELLVYVPGQIGDKARAALRKAGRLP